MLLSCSICLKCGCNIIKVFIWDFFFSPTNVFIPYELDVLCYASQWITTYVIKNCTTVITPYVQTLVFCFFFFFFFFFFSEKLFLYLKWKYLEMIFFVFIWIFQIIFFRRKPIKLKPHRMQFFNDCWLTASGRRGCHPPACVTASPRFAPLVNVHSAVTSNLAELYVKLLPGDEMNTPTVVPPAVRWRLGV